MGHNNGIIYAPVSIDDVRQVVGETSGDLAILCMSNAINMWSGIKPIYNTKVEQLSSSDFAGRTLSGYKTGGGIKKAALRWSEYISGMNTSTGSVVSRVWTYDKPLYDGACKFRLTDFSGYYHNVARTFNIYSLFGNISSIPIPSASGQTGSTIVFSFGFTNPVPDGGLIPSRLFGDCYNYYPAVILTNGSSDSNSYQYAKTADHQLSYYYPSSGTGAIVSISIDTADFASAIASDFSAAHSGDPYANYPLRTGDNWTGCVVLLSQALSGVHKVPSSATIVRLEYSSGVDRKTLPIKQTKYNNIEWMKMVVTINRVGIQSGNEVYRLTSIVVTAKMLTTSRVSFVINANLSTPQGTVTVYGVPDASNVENYSNVTFSGTVGEVSKSLSLSQTTYYVPQSASTGNKLCNGTLVFHNTQGDFSGGFSIDISSQSYQYEREVKLL